jgi:hypothetical protein
MKTKFLFLITMLVIAIGCTGKRYLDKPTPAASSIPPPPQDLVVSQEKPLERTSLAEKTEPYADAGDEYILDKTMTRENRSSKSKDSSSSGTINRFSKAYSTKGKPRIAIFLNRVLSDEVREWRTERRVVVSGEGSISSRRETTFSNREDTVKGPLTVYEEEQIELGGDRYNPYEEQLWSFEDGFMKPFLRAGAKLVDRATIMRLMALESNKKDSTAPISQNITEMKALVDKADIFVELLIARSPSSLYGYEFRAVAKEVKTGRIVGSATSMNWEEEEFTQKKIKATSEGYEITEETKIPKVKDLSRDLALDLMNALTTSWEISG